MGIKTFFCFLFPALLSKAEVYVVRESQTQVLFAIKSELQHDLTIHLLEYWLLYKGRLLV